MTTEGYRVLQAVAWLERMNHSQELPLRRIATDTLGGNGELAARVLSDLDQQGWVHAGTLGWQSGWLTPQGRVIATLVEPAS
jgi:hypothetical protein